MLGGGMGELFNSMKAMPEQAEKDAMSAEERARQVRVLYSTQK